jgi:hypothetical protein
MPLLDGLFHKGDGGPVVIPVATHAPIAFRVYYTPGYPPLAAEDLRVNASEWLDRHVEEPLRSALRPVVWSEKLSYTDMAKTAFPPPLEVLQKADVGAEERDRFEAAWQVAVIACEARTQVPMLGLWAAIAAGRSAAIDLKGALFDAVAVRLTSIPSYEQPIAGKGVLNAGDHLAFGSATNAAGLARWHTTGMSKFGFPDLELLEAPVGVDLRPVLEAVAQQLLDSLLRANHGRDEPLNQLSLDPELHLLLPGGPPAVRLFYSAAQGQMPPAIEVLLPRGA